jgi:hypothetical protein
MSVTLDMKWWKKTKPVTLVGETVTEAMKEVDSATEALLKMPTREHLSKLSGALKSLKAAFTQTKGKCNKTLHAACIKALTEAEGKAQGAYDAVQVMLHHFVQELEVYKQRRTKAAQALALLSAAKDTTKVPLAAQAVETFLNYLQHGLELGEFGSGEIERGMKYLAVSKLLLADLAKNRTPPADTGKMASWQKEIDGKFVELGQAADALAVLGGYTYMPAAAARYRVAGL